MSKRDALDAFALRVLRIFKPANLVEILARRNIARSERQTDKIARRRIGQANHALDEHIAKAALEQLRTERCRADAAQFFHRFRLERCSRVYHGMAPDFLTSFAQLGASRFIGAASSSCEFHVELPAELFIEVGTLQDVHDFAVASLHYSLWRARGPLDRPLQRTSRPGTPTSPIVGSSGASALGFSAVVARTLSLPACARDGAAVINRAFLALSGSAKSLLAEVPPTTRSGVGSRCRRTAQETNGLIIVVFPIL